MDRASGDSAVASTGDQTAARLACHINRQMDDILDEYVADWNAG